MIAGTHELLAAGTLVGAAAGFVMHRGEYCLTAAFRDPFLVGDRVLLRSVALLVAASMILFEAGRRAGLLPFYPFPFFGPPSAATAAGGVLFGLGMVLAGGCVAGSLYKLGAGRFVNAATVAGLVAGSGFYAEIHGAWAHSGVAAPLTRGIVTLPQLLGIDPAWAAVPAASVLFLAAARWRARGALSRPGRARGYVQPWAAAVLLALAGFASCLVSGMPIGITTSYAKAAARAEAAFVPERVAQHPYYSAVTLDVTDRLTGVHLRGGPGPAFDSVAAIQLPLIAGIVLGSALSALSVGEWRLRWRVPPRQIVLAFGGGLLMAVGSRVGAGCNVWHLLGGLPILALSSLLFAAGLVPGAWLGARAVARLL